MHEIIRIEIQGSSGNCPIAEAYHDILTIGPNYIRYRYVPLQCSEENPAQEWSYRTTSDTFQKRFCRIIKALPGALDITSNQIYTNIGGIEFYITYDNNTTDHRFFYVPADEFSSLFRLIKLLIPGSEDIPAVIMTAKDRENLEKRKNAKPLKDLKIRI